MEQIDEIIKIISLTMGAARAASINLYAAIATLGILEATDNITLPPELHILPHPTQPGYRISF